MPAGQHSKESRALSNVNQQLKTGKTRGANGRELSNEEIEALTQEKERYQKMLFSQAQQRRIHRINKHITSEADRVIDSLKDTVTEATKNSESFFQDVSGAGSYTDLKVRSKMLLARANETAKAERAAIRNAAKVEAKKQKDEQKAMEKANAKTLKDATKTKRSLNAAHVSSKEKHKLEGPKETGEPEKPLKEIDVSNTSETTCPDVTENVDDVEEESCDESCNNENVATVATDTPVSNTSAPSCPFTVTDATDDIDDEGIEPNKKRCKMAEQDTRANANHVTNMQAVRNMSNKEFASWSRRLTIGF